MSKRDGKLYIAGYLVTKIQLDTGQFVGVPNDEHGIAGMANVFWTKTAARKMYGRKAELIPIKMSKSDESSDT